MTLLSRELCFGQHFGTSSDLGRQSSSGDLDVIPPCGIDRITAHVKFLANGM